MADEVECSSEEEEGGGEDVGSGWSDFKAVEVLRHIT